MRVRHEDIKSANILVKDSGILVADFGIAKDVANETTIHLDDRRESHTPMYAASRKRPMALFKVMLRMCFQWVVYFWSYLPLYLLHRALSRFIQHRREAWGSVNYQRCPRQTLHWTVFLWAWWARKNLLKATVGLGKTNEYGNASLDWACYMLDPVPNDTYHCEAAIITHLPTILQGKCSAPSLRSVRQAGSFPSASSAALCVQRYQYP